MKELFRERELTRVTYYQSLIEGADIPTFMKNENVSVMEGVSIPEFFPALCVVNDADYDAAIKIIQEDLLSSENNSSDELVCGVCGKMSPANFEICWSCQSALPETKNSG